MKAIDTRLQVPKPHASLEPRVDVRAAPINLKPDDISRFENTAKYQMPGASVCVLEDVIAADRGPLESAGQYVWDSFVTPEEGQEWLSRRGNWRHRLEQSVSRWSSLNDPALWITDTWSFGYFHWTLDALQRLELASRSYDLSKLTLLLPSKCRRFRYIAESLKPFNLKEVRFMKRFERIRCDEMIFPSQIATTGNQDRGLMADIRNRISSYLGVNSHDTKQARRIYISRRCAGSRRVDNENEILTTLKKHGFEDFVAENNDWQTQMRVCATADQIVSNHGGGLTNLFMMKPGSRVLEMRSATGRTPNCFSNLASATDIDFYYLLCQQVDPSQTAHRGNVMVDPDQLDQALSEFVASFGMGSPAKAV